MGKKRNCKANRTDSGPHHDSCPHFEKGFNLSSFRKSLNACQSLVCSFSSCNEQNLHICLQCGRLLCMTGASVKISHIAEHYARPRSDCHSLYISISCDAVCCVECDRTFEVLKGDRTSNFVSIVLKTKTRLSSTDNRPAVLIGTSPKQIEKDTRKLRSSIEPNGVFSARGLDNIGNTCFFNSVLQSLVPMNRFFQIMGRLKSGCVFVSDGISLHVKDDEEITTCVTDLLGSYFQGSDKLTPRPLFKAIANRFPMFKGHEQQDSQELFACLINGLFEEHETRVKKSLLSKYDVDHGKDGTPKKSEKHKFNKELRGSINSEWKIFQSLNPMSAFFGGMLTRYIKCLSCSHIIPKSEPFICLSLSMSVPNPAKSLHDHSRSLQTQSTKCEDKLHADPCHLGENSTESSACRKELFADPNQSSQDLIDPSIPGQTDSEVSPINVLENPSQERHLRSSGDVFIVENSLDYRTSIDSSSKDDSFIDTSEYQFGGNVDKSGNEEYTSVSTELKNEASPDSGMSSPRRDSAYASQASLNSESEEARVAAERTSNCGANASGIDTLECEFGNLGLGGLFDELEDDCRSYGERKEEEESNSSDDSSEFFNPGALMESTPEKSDTDNKGSENELLASLSPQPVAKEGELSVISLLQSFTSQEVMTGCNKIRCENCCKELDGQPHLSSATCWYRITCAPATLVIHLKRFAQCGLRLRKVNTHVKIPLLLDLAPFCSTDCPIESRATNRERILYGLYAIVEHVGSLAKGHYTAFVKHTTKARAPTDSIQHLLDRVKREDVEETESETTDEAAGEDTWYHISDRNVKKVQLKTVLQSSAYMLFYEKLSEM